MMKHAVSVAALSCLTLVSTAAFGGESQAELLFDRGVKALIEEDYEAACPALRESYELEPLPGVLFTLAECERGSGELVASRDHYQTFLEQIAELKTSERRDHADRAEASREALAELADRIPRLTLDYPEGLPSDVEVTVDGRTRTRSVGRPWSLEPGPHEIKLVRAGAETRVEIRLEEGDRVLLAPELPEPPVPSAAKNAPMDDVRRDGESGNGAAWVLGGVGVAGLLVGGATGMLAWREKGTIDDHCDQLVCDPEGEDAAHRAQRMARISTVSFGAGATALVGATTLFLVKRKKNREASRVTVVPDVAPAQGGIRAGLDARVRF